MSGSVLLLCLLAIGIVAYWLGRTRANALAGAKLSSMHSRPSYHGGYTFVWSVLPAILLLAVWVSVSPTIVETTVARSFPQDVLAAAQSAQNLEFGIIRSIARGLTLLSSSDAATLVNGTGDVRALLSAKGVPLAGDPKPYMMTAALELNRLTSISQWLMTAAVIALSFGGLFFSLKTIAPKLRARNRVERVILGSLIAASSVAILTTIGIIASMLGEASHFFSMVPAHEFFFGTVWDPRFAAAGAGNSEGQFGLIPLLLGTLYIGLVAMLVAVPVGLFSAIYMAEYASPRLRAFAKPMLEVLAGIPTIVYGFFAMITVGPFLRDISAQIDGIVTGNFQNFIQAQSVLTAGFVMGIMLIPYVSSLSDDIITAVPRALRDGSLGLGATRSETVKKVILPAALPGIVGALLMTASRAVGETMIVVLAAGVAARIQINPFEPMTTVTVKIVNQLTGDLEFTSPQTLVAFALGITLFALTLCLNIYALYIVRKYREQYE